MPPAIIWGPGPASRTFWRFHGFRRLRRPATHTTPMSRLNFSRCLCVALRSCDTKSEAQISWWYSLLVILVNFTILSPPVSSGARWELQTTNDRQPPTMVHIIHQKEPRSD